MSTIQNLKNFIRHGKQARDSRSPQDQATTHISNVHAHQQQRHGNVGVTEPNLHETKPVHNVGVPHEYSMAAGDQRNQAAKAGHAAAEAVDRQQKRQEKAADYDPQVLERIVAEERESKGKLPKYPGLDRYRLIEKMGDGAFSNVYRAKDTTGEYGEVAIKVVRKFEMNQTQVCLSFAPLIHQHIPFPIPHLLLRSHNLTPPAF